MTDAATDAISVGVWQHLSGSTWGKIGQIDKREALSFEPRHLQAGPWVMSLPLNPQSAKVTPQHLLTFDFRDMRFTGVITHDGPSSDSKGNWTRDLSGLDAMSLLGKSLVVPTPSTTLSTTGTFTFPDEYYVATGVAETVLRQVIKACLVDLLGVGLALAPDQGRGGVARLHERNTTVLDVVVAKCQLAGLGVSVGLVDTTSTRAELTCSFYQPRDLSRRVTISQSVGTLRSWSQSDDAPTATRALVAGGGKGPARVFRLVVAQPAEAAWPWPSMVLTDARDTSDADVLSDRGLSDLADKAAQSSYDLEAYDTVGTRFGLHFGVGDSITVHLVTGASKVDTLGSATVNVDSSGLLTTQLHPGNPDGGKVEFRRAALMRAIQAQLRSLQQKES